jgi:hypothetical protein
MGSCLSSRQPQLNAAAKSSPNVALKMRGLEVPFVAGATIGDRDDVIDRGRQWIWPLGHL